MSHVRNLYCRSDGPLYAQPPNAQARRAMKVPANATPCVKVLIAEMQRTGRTYDSLAEASGVLRATVKSWRHRSSPSFATIESAFGALGWAFIPCPKIEVLPEEIAADLGRLASKMKAGLPEVWAALAELAADQAFLRERAKERIEAREAEREARRINLNKRRPRKPANDNIRKAASAA